MQFFSVYNFVPSIFRHISSWVSKFLVIFVWLFKMDWLDDQTKPSSFEDSTFHMQNVHTVVFVLHMGAFAAFYFASSIQIHIQIHIYYNVSSFLFIFHSIFL